MNIYDTKYKDIEAIAVENGNLRAVFLPTYGGKMASLMCNKTGREFLVQADGETYNKLAYAGSYIDAECSGFDDMFPTIDKWTYDKHPWQGAEMPDHGEVCGLPWDYEVTEGGTCLHCWVYGVRFPYRLDKRIRFADDGTLVIDYEVENLSPFNLDFIWAAHVMINAEQDARIIVPYADGATGTCVFSADAAFSESGETIRWPRHRTAGGGVVDISTTQSKDRFGNTYKYYFDTAMPDGRFGYAYGDGTTLTLGVSKETVPYLGVWVNDGAFKGYHNIALEPCTGTFDDPAGAIAHGQNSVLPGSSARTWQMSFCVH